MSKPAFDATTPTNKLRASAKGWAQMWLKENPYMAAAA
jgi:hypothetical protein